MEPYRDTVDVYEATGTARSPCERCHRPLESPWVEVAFGSDRRVRLHHVCVIAQCSVTALDPTALLDLHGADPSGFGTRVRGEISRSVRALMPDGRYVVVDANAPIGDERLDDVAATLRGLERDAQAAKTSTKRIAADVAACRDMVARYCLA